VKLKILENKFLFFIIFIYVGILLSLLTWGLPGSERVFTYHMDEWHQFKSIVGLWQHGSNNISGAANGPSAQFIFSGIYLLPFILIGFIKPHMLTAVTNLEMQRRLFEVLRLNTLVFGIGAIYVLYLILKKNFKINPIYGLTFFTFSPSFLILSNYFKYDIALIFWILLALKLMLEKRTITAGIVTGLALATKISAFPLVGVYILSYLLYKNWRKNIQELFWGLAGLFLVFVFLGIPDVLLGLADYGQYKEFFESNLITQPGFIANIKLNLPWWLYLLIIRFPMNLGYGLMVGIVGVMAKGRETLNKNWKLITWGLILFFLSTLPLKLAAIGNRTLVLLPFMAILVSYYFSKLKSKLGKTIAILLVFIQVGSSLYLISPKWKVDPRQASSVWLNNHVALGTEIGLENNPIYEMIPDVLLKDYYSQQYGLKNQAKYQYQIIDAKSEKLPSVVVVINHDQAEKYKQSSKSDLINRLKQENYQEMASFKQQAIEFDYIPSIISVFIKKSLQDPTL